MSIIFSDRFIEEMDRLIRRDPKCQKKLHKCLRLLVLNTNYPSLRFHKLTGLDKYSISIDMKIRILFCFKGEDIYLLRIGTHDDVY
jgi:mRNA-degrading endonuclease YafQ of YafQ-DinJ toxin-antitoxin module